MINIIKLCNIKPENNLKYCRKCQMSICYNISGIIYYKCELTLLAAAGVMVLPWQGRKLKLYWTLAGHPAI